MKINYKVEYYKLIANIKYKLSKLYLKKDLVNNYQTRLANIASKIDYESEDFEYYEAFIEASKIENELTNILRKHQSLILPAYETKDYLKDRIHSVKECIKKIDINNQKLGIKLITYFLTGSIFITAGAYTLVREKDSPKEKLYLTTETTYNDSKDNTRYKYHYEKVDPTLNKVIIKEVTPWIPGEKEATRFERIYQINNLSYDEIINNRDYEKIIANLEYDERIDTMTMTAYNGIQKYTEPLYEVTETSQDENHYIEKNHRVSKETIALLFAELVIYMTILNLNQEPLFETIFKTARDINSNNKIINYQTSTLELLKTQVKETKKKARKK